MERYILENGKFMLFGVVPNKNLEKYFQRKKDIMEEIKKARIEKKDTSSLNEELDYFYSEVKAYCGNEDYLYLISGEEFEYHQDIKRSFERKIDGAKYSLRDFGGGNISKIDSEIDFYGKSSVFGKFDVELLRNFSEKYLSNFKVKISGTE